MGWLYLVIAGLFECGWAIGLKYTEGFTKLVPSLITVFSMVISFWLLSLSMKTVPVGTAYAIWAGIGAVGVVAIEMFFLGGNRSVETIICLFMIVFGIVGLKLFTPT